MQGLRLVPGGVGALLQAVLTLALPLPAPRALAFAPLHTFDGSFQFIGLLMGAVGLVVLASGILDHRLLLHTVASIARESVDRPVEALARLRVLTYIARKKNDDTRDLVD